MERTGTVVDDIVTVLNCLLYEFTLEGLVSAPITDTDVQDCRTVSS